MQNVEQWAELRRLHFVQGISIKELHRRTGLHRQTIRRALRSSEPPRYEREGVPSKLDAFKDEIHHLLRADPHLPNIRVRELIAPLGYAGAQTILDEYLREVRPLFLPAVRTYQRTEYRPGGIVHCCEDHSTGSAGRRQGRDHTYRTTEAGERAMARPSGMCSLKRSHRRSPVMPKHRHVGESTPGYLPEGDVDRADTLAQARALMQARADEYRDDADGNSHVTGNRRDGYSVEDRDKSHDLGLVIWHDQCERTDCEDDDA